MTEAAAPRLTPKQIFEERIHTRLQADPAKAKALNAIYQFDLTGENGGTWTIDLPQAQVVVGPAAGAQCTITISSTDFVDLMAEKLNPQMAFMQGRLKVAGDMSLALKLTSVLKG